jgi:hypothetical protein
MIIKRLIPALIIALALIPQLSAQDQYKNNPAYGPIAKNQSLSVVKRLSYENFRNIKMLQAAIRNFGGGEEEINKLIDQYADASAFYFQNQIDQASDKFLENERDILETAKKLAKTYKDDADKMLTDAVRDNIKARLNLAGGPEDNRARRYDTYIQAARFSMTKGTDYYDRYVNARQAPPRELVNSIYYYRRVKENVISMSMTIELDQIDAERQTKKSARDDRDDKEKRKKDVRAKYAEKYKKEIEDNNNRVYLSREKHN